MTIKNLARLVLSTAVFMMLATGAMAQQGKGRPSPEERAEQQTKHMSAQLGLSQEQAAKVKEINLKYAKQQQEHRGSREDMMKMNDEKNAELKGVLTEAQYQKHMDRNKQMKQKKVQKQDVKQKGKKEKGGKKLKGVEMPESEG